MNAPPRRRRGRQGFTLIEVVIVVLIVAIAAALGIPALNELRVNMEMAQLNNTAKQIYLVAQNRLIAMRSAGTLALNVTGSGSLGTASIGTETLAFSAKENPGGDVMAYIMPAASISPEVLNDGYYVIVFDDSHGLVQEVYYAQRAIGRGGGVTDARLTALRGDARQRRDERIGFYNGDGAFAASVERLGRLSVDLVNGEQLLVRLTLPALPAGVAAGDLQIELSVENAADESQKVAWTLDCGSGGGFDGTDPINGVYTKILDSLDRPFRQVVDDGSSAAAITPGANIKVSAKLICPAGAVGNMTLLPSDLTTATTNSLFASAISQSTGSGDPQLAVNVAAGRHLENLALIDDPSAVLDGVGDRFIAAQTADLDFSAGGAWAAAYPGREHAPVTNERLAAYDGGRNKIIGLTKPLFDTFGVPGEPAGFLIQNVRLESPAIRVDSGYSCGGLANITYGSQISGCHVYGAAGSITSSVGSTTGGLIGYAFDCAVTYCSVALPEITVSGGGGMQFAGGLIGQSWGLSGSQALIAGCYANVNNLNVNGGNVGMLMGNNISGTTIYNCYAIGAITGSARLACGMIGTHAVNSGGERFYDCYVLVNLERVNAGNKYVILVPSETSPLTGAEKLYYVPEVSGASASTNIYSTAITKEQLASGLDAGGASLFQDTSYWSIGGAFAYPYDSALGNRYPYPAIRQFGEHRGDWPA